MMGFVALLEEGERGISSCTHLEERPYENTVSRWPSATEGDSPHQTLTLLVPGSSQPPEL